MTIMIEIEPWAINSKAPMIEAIDGTITAYLVRPSILRMSPWY
jgi:hypothetical protein